MPFSLAKFRFDSLQLLIADIYSISNRKKEQLSSSYECLWTKNLFYFWTVHFWHFRCCTTYYIYLKQYARQKNTQISSSKRFYIDWAWTWNVFELSNEKRELLFWSNLFHVPVEWALWRIMACVIWIKTRQKCRSTQIVLARMSLWRSCHAWMSTP